jgi:drug/metabolite transporter (DMT)-like permease
LGGLFLAAVLLKEAVSPSRVAGAVVIVVGLAVIGSESLRHTGSSAVTGDLIFVLTGLMFAGFATLIRYWRVSAFSVATVISVLSLSLFPLYAASGGLARDAALGVSENALQAIGQGLLAGPAAMYLFALSIQKLGVARGAVFPAVVPVLTLLLGWLLIGEPPTVLQASGLVVVLTGFYLAQRQS